MDLAARVTVTVNVLIDVNLTRCCHITSGAAACCTAGDGERLERVQPPGERRGLAEGGPAGTDEPQRSFSGPFPYLLTSIGVVSSIGYLQIKLMNTGNRRAWELWTGCYRTFNTLIQIHWCVFFCEQHEKVQMRKELWRIEDVIAGLSTSKANYQVTISSVTNPG